LPKGRWRSKLIGKITADKRSYNTELAAAEAVFSGFERRLSPVSWVINLREASPNAKN